jgi:hypothetical protein
MLFLSTDISLPKAEYFIAYMHRVYSCKKPSAGVFYMPAVAIHLLNRSTPYFVHRSPQVYGDGHKQYSFMGCPIVEWDKPYVYLQRFFI